MLSLVLPLHAFTPVLGKVDPPGGQIGTEVQVNFYGERLDGISTALFYEPGITLAGLEVKDGKTATAKFVIAPDAVLGEHSLRLAGRPRAGARPRAGHSAPRREAIEPAAGGRSARGQSA